MAHTPYPDADPEFENPSISVSNDGTTWQDPVGITNPIDPSPDGAGFNADTELVYDAAADRLICYWGRFTGDKVICARTSTDGVNWSERVDLLIYEDSPVTFNPVSFSVRKVGATWMMWYVDTVAAPNTFWRLTSSDPLSGWSAPEQCTVAGVPPGRDVWHPQVFHDAGEFRGVWCVTELGTSSFGRVHLARSTDGLAWELSPPVLLPGATGEWDAALIYRATAWPDGHSLRIWYSAAAASNEWRIGETSLPTAAFA